MVEANDLAAGRMGSARRNQSLRRVTCLSSLILMSAALRAMDLADPAIDEIKVTAERLGLLGTTTTASEGVVVNDELSLTPAYRVGQLLETVPGLQVTSHSGEGKANQYLLRGYNLDHGTDLATFVDGMPVNEPTHAHGQGYTDLNFLIPELATNVKYRKGTYYADEGDFSSVGAVHINLLNRLDDQVSLTGGTLGYRRLFAGGSTALDGGALLGAFELLRYDGPWVDPDDLRKINAVLRFSEGSATDGVSVTLMHYRGNWNSTTDQPERAIAAGLISRFGSLDPSDGGEAQRSSLTLQYVTPIGAGEVAAGAYVFGNRLTLWNDFTHFLVDPVNGDQEAQHESRTTAGGTLTYLWSDNMLGVKGDFQVGAGARTDFNQVSRFPTHARQIIPLAAESHNFNESDGVRLDNLWLYGEVATHWTPWFRSVLGVRLDTLSGSDNGTNRGSAGGHLWQPKGSAIFRPWSATELYVSTGRGFHSDDLRGVTAAQINGLPSAPLIARQSGSEVGVRQSLSEAFTATLAFYTLEADSETTYDPDAGVDTAGPGSRRRGFEINLTYQALRWLELYGSYSGNHARFTSPYNDGTGHVGSYLPNAPTATGSFNAYVKGLGSWSGSFGYRYLSGFPLSSDNAAKGHGYGEWSADAQYAAGHGFSVGLGLFNILNKRADAAQFWYIDRLTGEPAAGVADVHVHPLEGRTARLTLEQKF
jgi:hypothetical protein